MKIKTSFRINVLKENKDRSKSLVLVFGNVAQSMDTIPWAGFCMAVSRHRDIYMNMSQVPAQVLWLFIQKFLNLQSDLHPASPVWTHNFHR